MFWVGGHVPGTCVQKFVNPGQVKQLVFGVGATACMTGPRCPWAVCWLHTATKVVPRAAIWAPPHRCTAVSFGQITFTLG